MEFEFGELDGSDTPRLKEMARLFSDIGISKTTSNIWGTLWSKLVHNCMANAPSGLTGLSSNPMYMNATARRVMARLGREAVLVGEAHGIKFDEIYGVPSSTFKRLEAGGEQEINDAILKEARARTGARDNPPSLLQDVQKGRRSEVDYLNGLVVRKGAQKGVPAPLNQAITEAMHRVDGKVLKPGVQNLELFKKYL
jgi:2-dehydropantoate 2-reductase